jgi:glyceraldehyde-3-phosphate dehydrogenase (NADP+)
MQNHISKNQLFDVFSTVNSKEIPFINQEEYLVNGAFKPWNGSFNEIHSAICKPTSGEKLERILIGKIPKTGLPEAMECLESAELAYDNGFGEWPMFSVEKRISHVEHFVKNLIEP